MKASSMHSLLRSVAVIVQGSVARNNSSVCIETHVLKTKFAKSSSASKSVASTLFKQPSALTPRQMLKCEAAVRSNEH
eukprot:scaffold10896_cov20-Prasinocladus_malaysianus.AAC.2